MVMTGSVFADRLPNQTPENQLISISTVLDVIGTVSDSTSMSWVIASPGSIPSGMLGLGQSIATVGYHDSSMTNGGHLMLNKQVGYDSRDKSAGLYNIDTQKVLTYASIAGSHLVGEEEYTLSVAGSAATSDGALRCVFSQGQSTGAPAFCNIVTAKSSLINVNSAQISSKGQIRAVAASADTPAELNYQIAVTPDSSSGQAYADATVKTLFAGSIMEARDSSGDKWNKTAAENSWKDATSVNRWH